MNKLNQEEGIQDDGAIKEVCHKLDLGLAAYIAKELEITVKEAYCYRKMLADKGNLYRETRTINRVHDKQAEAHFMNIV